MDQTESSSQNAGSTEALNGTGYGTNSRAASAHDTVDRLANAARPAVDRLASSAHSAVDRMTTFASSAASTLGQRREQFSTQGAELAESARTYVRENPMAAVGIAAAVGFLLSRIMSSR